MSKRYVYFGLIGCALSVAAGHSIAGPSKADLEKALSACPPGQSEGKNGLCQPSQGDQMGYEAPDTTGGAKPPAATKSTHGAVATVGAVQTGRVDLQMTFARASWTLTDADKATANTLIQVLTEPANAAKLVEIGGHTSSTGDAAFNEELSKKRADAVKSYLVANGIPAARLIAVGYGSKQPQPGTDPSAPENRRVVLTMLGTTEP